MASTRTLLILAPLLALAGCGKPAEVPTNATQDTVQNMAEGVEPEGNITAIEEDGDAVNMPAEAAPSALAGWAGRWIGPEGLFLDIKPAPDGSVALTIKDNLDTQADYKGMAKGEAITFERAGKTETIRPGTGAETGFKYLADKKDCLIIVPGKEGYCRK